MVLIGEKKYACETCIKGHRSSSCKHTDRPLFEIKRKGRPVSQCEHCRELRKTKQVHVKCSCEGREDGEGPTSLSKKAAKKVEGAAFPAGLPEALEASLALQLLAEGSESDHSNPDVPGSSCACKSGGTCTCCTPRQATSRSQRKGKARDSKRLANVEEQIVLPAGIVVNAHSGDYRPVLPRPPNVPTDQVHPIARHQSHGHDSFSPYGRAYEFAHVSETVSPQSPQQISSQPGSIRLPYPVPDAFAPLADASQPFFVVSPPVFDPDLSTCACGESCACLGCVQHRGTLDVAPGMPCTNSSTCVSCLDCTMNSVPSTIFDSSPLYASPSLETVEDWIRQVATPSSATSSSQSAISPSQMSDAQRVGFDPSLLQTYAIYDNIRLTQLSASVRSTPEECCGGRCKCPAGLCSCAADCCGCCQGCQCIDCNHDDDLRETLTFATSGERAPCCSGGANHASQSSAGMRVYGGVAEGNEGSLAVPNASLSRVSSTSPRTSDPQSSQSISSVGSCCASRRT